MNDSVYLDDMKLAYKQVLNDNHEVELKAYEMIAIIGVMLSIETSIIINYEFQSFVLMILFSMTLFFNLISILFFIKNIFTKKYISLPSSTGIVKYYEENYSEELYLSTMIGNYQWAIDENTSLVNLKSSYSQKGLYLFSAGIIILVVFILGSLIL